MIRKNLKLILLFVLGAICAVGITFAYTVSSKNIAFKSTNWNVKNVEEAVSYLKDENKCSSLTPKIVNIISGDINTVGSVVQIGDEEFYIAGQGSGEEEGYTKLLAKYNLKNNNQTSSGAQEIYFSSSNYWTDNGSNPYPYVYNDNSNLYSVVNSYVDKISALGVNDVKGRLISYEEANALSTDIRKSIGTDRYWTGSAKQSGVIWVVGSTGVIDWVSYTICNQNVNGVRPLLLIPTNEIG